MTLARSDTQIAFIGTGIMGVPMCRRLLQAGYPVRIWNRTIEKAAPLAAIGGEVYRAIGEALDGASVVLSMLENGPVTDKVLFEARGASRRAVDILQPGATVAVMSSIPVETARRHAESLRGQGVDYVDAPVSGGESGAVEGSLTIMAGGDGAAVERLRPILEVLGRLTRIGPTGAGQICKLANQTIVGITIGAVAEALMLASAAGADIGAVHAALAGGFAESRILREHGQRMIDRAFTPGGRADLQLKDLHTARLLAESLNFDMPLLRLSEAQYRRMVDLGHGEKDHSALYLLLQQPEKGEEELSK